MRPLTPTLLTAQQSPTQQPILQLRILDQPVEWPRWTWSPLYTSSDPDGPHATGQLASGPLIRARQTIAGALYTQRVDDPTNPTQWAAWTLLKPAGTTLSSVGIALAASDTADLTRLFWVDTADGRTIRCAESTDGLAWIEEVVITEPAPRQVRGLAADLAAGDNHLIYALDYQVVSPSQVLVAIERTAPATWTNRVAQPLQRHPIVGLAAARDPATSTIHVVAADGDPIDAARRLVVLPYDGAAGTWGADAVLLRAPIGSDFVYRAPRLRLATPSLPRHLYSYVEQYVGTPAYDRVMLACTSQLGFLPEAVPWDADTPHGRQPLRTASGWHLVGATSADRAPVESGGTGHLVDASADVVSVEAIEPGPNRPARLTVLLDNASGAYAAAGQPGPLLALREGSQLALGLGLRTTAGAEHVWAVPWWIERVGYEDERGAGYLRLECVDAWSYLERLRAPRQLTFPAGATVADLLNRLLWRVTGTTLAAAGPLATVLPGFTVGPGESYAGALRRLCRLAGVVVRFGTEQSAPDGVGFASVVPTAPAFASGPASYGYAAAPLGTDHPITRARYLAGGQAFSQIEVFGAGALVGDAFDHVAIRRLWKSVPRKVVDRSMDSQAKVDALVGYELTAARAAAVDGYLEAGAHVGLEIGDVVTVTDPRAGLAAATRTVVGIRTVYDRRASLKLTQRIALAGAS